MAGAKAGRSLPPGDEPWQTFTVKVRSVRGRAEVYASVELSHVTGIVGSTSVRPRPIWQGVVRRREAGVRYGPEEAAQDASYALGKAFPSLF